MENISSDNFENNKNIEDVDSNAKKLAALLLPKMGSQQKNKYNYNEMEKNFYKTSGKDFFNNNKANKIKKYTSDKFFNANQKRIISGEMNKKYYTSNSFFKNRNNNNEKNENTVIKLLQQKINEIENELEHNENTFTHNKKVMLKKLEEKDQQIKKLTKNWKKKMKIL